MHRVCERRGARLAGGLLALWIAAGPAVAASPAPVLSRFRLVAVAPFVDEVGRREDLANWAAGRLAQLLAREGVRVVPPAQVGQSLHQMGLRPPDLVSPTAAGNLGRRLGADAVITGRLLSADVEVEPGVRGPLEGPPEALVVLGLRVMTVDGRQLFYDDVAGYAIGRFTGLVRATDAALRDFVRRVTRDDARRAAREARRAALPQS